MSIQNPVVMLSLKKEIRGATRARTSLESSAWSQDIKPGD
jgi:hypothetical protein